MSQSAATEQYKRIPRLYVAASPLAPGAAVPLEDGQAHYLRNVMRLAPGAGVRVFNGRDGEWLAALAGSKKSASLEVGEKIAEQAGSADVWAVASPVKKDAFELMVEKATELGASRFLPVLCDHTAVRRMNEARAAAIAVEAAEQSERLDVPAVEPLRELRDVLAEWDPSRKIMFCLERGTAQPIAVALEEAKDSPLAVLIGPEGGFSEEEIREISDLPFVRPVTLGPGILKAETALISALSCLRAFSCCCM